MAQTLELKMIGGVFYHCATTADSITYFLNIKLQEQF
jgi:hypothetical protein